MPANHQQAAWTDADDAKLIALQELNLSARQAGIKMGRSKGSVISRAIRIGKRFKGPVTGRPSKPASAKAPRQRHRLPPTYKFKEAVMRIEPLYIPFMQLNEYTHCREVVGRGEDGLALYCGHRRREHSSYCPSCSARNEHVAPPRKYVRAA